MDGWIFTSEGLRARYRGGRADGTARWLARFWAVVFGLGLLPRRWVTLEVPGRRSGRLLRFPLGMANVEGRWYLVPFLGEQCNWVQNVRANGNRATLRRRRRVGCQLVEVPVSERSPIIKRYLDQVPGARPHIPVDRRAPMAAFDDIAARYPVFEVPALRAMAGRKRWWRWLLVCLAALVVTVPLAAGLVVELQHVPAPLALPAAAARRPTGPLAGSWSAAAGSVAGFRVRESAVGWSNDVVGRTTRVTGAVVISGREVASAKFQVGLAGVTAGGKPQPQFLASLHASKDPVADVTLARPVALPRAFAAGATVTARAPARLALNGVNRPVTVTITARRSGAAVQLAGSIPVQFSAWRISGPTSYGFIASLADSGVAEFYLVLHR